MIGRTQTAPRLIWAQITDEQMADTARSFLRTSGNIAIRLFDTYRIAAEKMIKTHFNHGKRESVRHADIMGFGKFGRDLLEVLITDLNGRNPVKIRVIDIQDRQTEVMKLASELGYSEHVEFKKADIRDLPALYQEGKASFICTDDDLKNLTAAMTLARKYDTDHLYVRMSQWPLAAVSEHIGEKHGIKFINISELVLEGIRHLAGVFQAAEMQDVKRVTAQKFERQTESAVLNPLPPAAINERADGHPLELQSKLTSMGGSSNSFIKPRQVSGWDLRFLESFDSLSTPSSLLIGLMAGARSGRLMNSPSCCSNNDGKAHLSP